MPHPLVDQLRFTRSEFKRALAGVSEEDARHHFAPMNCISWTVGHMASQEQRYWLYRGQDYWLLPAIHEQYNYGARPTRRPSPACGKPGHAITAAADPWLDSLTTADLVEQRPFTFNGEPNFFTFGNLMQRVIYHYWYHTGQIMAIRQQLGHRDLPEFVGNIDDEAPYRPE